MIELGEAPGEKIEWGKAPDLPGVELVLAENCARRWRVFHETYSICTGLAIARPAEWRYRGRTHDQPANGLSLMEPGELHANTRITDPAAFRVLMVDPAVVSRAAESLGMARRPHLKMAQLKGGPIHAAFLGLHRSLEQPAGRLERQSRFDACVRLVLENCAESPPASHGPSHDAPVERARAYIHEHVAEQIGLDELAAAAAGLSRFHLVRAFSARFGLPPHAYQIQLRISRGRRLLGAGLPPAQVAFTLGFADQSHFTRHFRGMLKITPARYARALAAGARGSRTGHPRH